MRLAVMGLGNLGSAVAYMAAQNNHQIIAWEYDEAVVDEVNSQHSNQRYLAGIELPANIVATKHLAQALDAAELVFITLPSRFVEATFTELLREEKISATLALVNMSKGLNANTGETVFQCLQRLLPKNSKAMLAGPSLANEFVQGVVTGLVAASDNLDLQQKIAAALNGSSLSVQFSDDPIGTELGGVLKNIYALGLGVVDGQQGAGLNFKGAYLTVALSEMTELAVSCGAQKKSLNGISGVGDLIATALSEHSHNRKMGELIAQGFSTEKLQQTMGVLPEGYNSLQAILQMAKRVNLDIPLAKLIAKLLNQSISISDFFQAFSALLKK